jgi:hydroxysqualene synthase
VYSSSPFSPQSPLTHAYAVCETLARQHYENFPVASRLLPAAMRPHIAVIYAFARTADDFADEPGLAAEERLRRLEDFRQRLLACETRRSEAPDDQQGLIFLALAHTIRQRHLPVSLFEDLLSAFRQDVTTKRYQTWTDVLDYCRRSANPVGRLVLRVAGYEDRSLDDASDAVCTALQLTNFWQDLERDWAIGRLYVPRDDLARGNAREADLDAKRLTAEWRAVMTVMVERTRELFTRGRSVCDGVSGRLRWQLRATWLGGTRILDKLERADFDVFNHRPTLSAKDVPGLLTRALLWH